VALNQEQVIMACVRYAKVKLILSLKKIGVICRATPLSLWFRKNNKNKNAL
jgi:hypothetical protein